MEDDQAFFFRAASSTHNAQALVNCCPSNQQVDGKGGRSVSLPRIWAVEWEQWPQDALLWTYGCFGGEMLLLRPVSRVEIPS